MNICGMGSGDSIEVGLAMADNIDNSIIRQFIGNLNQNTTATFGDEGCVFATKTHTLALSQSTQTLSTAKVPRPSLSRLPLYSVAGLLSLAHLCLLLL